MLSNYVSSPGLCSNDPLICASVPQTAEEVSFAANGITADGIKAFDGVLQSNVALKTLDLSGNPIGDEGAKVTMLFKSSIW